MTWTLPASSWRAPVQYWAIPVEALEISEVGGTLCGVDVSIMVASWSWPHGGRQKAFVDWNNLSAWDSRELQAMCGRCVDEFSMNCGSVPLTCLLNRRTYCDQSDAIEASPIWGSLGRETTAAYSVLTTWQRGLWRLDGSWLKERFQFVKTWSLDWFYLFACAEKYNSVYSFTDVDCWSLDWFDQLACSQEVGSISFFTADMFDLLAWERCAASYYRCVEFSHGVCHGICGIPCRLSASCRKRQSIICWLKDHSRRTNHV